MTRGPGRSTTAYRGAARRLQCTLGKAVAVAKAVEAAPGSSRGTDRSDSPRSADESSGGTAAVEAQERQGLCKRRKGLPRWTAKFRVPDANLEATPDDGFSWRKYGQKDILGAKFPRGYYRCTYRTSQGCPATKQVQRSDTDLCVFDVTYQGEHTCHQKQRHAAVAAHGGGGSQSPPQAPSHEPQQQYPSMQLLMGFKDALKVETEAPHLHDRDFVYDHGPASAPAAPFSFPSVPFHHHAAGEAPATAAFSPPGSSYSYFSAPHQHHCPVVGAAGSYDVVDVYDYEAGAGAGSMRGAAESSELGEVVSRATSAPAAGFDYASLFHHAELDPHLPFPPFGGPSHGPYQ